MWNVALSEYGAYIIEKRIAFIEQINSQLNDAYNIIAKSNPIDKFLKRPKEASS